MTTISQVTIEDLERVWKRVGGQDGFLASPVPHPLSFQLGKDRSGNRCFAVVGMERGIKLESSMAITVRCDKVSKDKWTLMFILEDAGLTEIFVKLCWDLIECSRSVSDPEVAILYQYKKWRRMLAKWSGGGMSEIAQKGLLGELLYLKGLIKDIGEEAAIVSWQGPEGADQDFEFESSWAEIKTVKLSANEITISSLQQLDRQEPGIMVVYFADKDSSSSDAASSVKDVVEELFRSIKNPTCRDLLECKLARTGYYSGITEFCRFRVERSCSYRVEPGFPKITVGNVPIEVTAAQYSVSIPAIQRFSREDEI